MVDASTVAELLGPQDDEIVLLAFQGDAARKFVALLNKCQIRDHNGQRLTFHWQHYGDGWTLAMESHDD